ncbi:MAG: terpene cyclase/mutase family protein, partial [Candidatus Diapherotrites archaeon]|nr:terpene cyclase/mutase family protein [Candidatus Diapherotrites archaeon]
ENNDAIALDYLDGRIPDAFEWLLDFQKSNGEIGSNVFQHSIALSALSLAASSNIDAENAISNAVSNLLSKQSPDSGFGDELYTSVATMALLSNGKSLDEFDVSGKTSVELLEERQQSDGGFKSGSSTSDVDTSSWALLAFKQAGFEAPLKDGKSPIDYLILAQHSNGSFGYNASDASESIDFTEEALIAFGVAGAESSESAGKAIEWLSGRQDSEGCISDGFRTAFSGLHWEALHSRLEMSWKIPERQQNA